MDNPVITKEQARKITRGRTPLVPVEYEQAINSLQACVDIDDAKYWSNAADALAAWAKMYRNDAAGRKAKMLKLHAYRRMGILAQELRPAGSRKMGTGNGKGSLPGPRALLESHGLSTAASDAARTLGNLPQRQFDKLLRNPVAPTTARHMVRDITVWHDVQRPLMSLRSVMRRQTPASVVSTLSDVEAENALELSVEVGEWLYEFEERIEKRSKGT